MSRFYTLIIVAAAVVCCATVPLTASNNDELKTRMALKKKLYPALSGRVIALMELGGTDVHAFTAVARQHGFPVLHDGRAVFNLITDAVRTDAIIAALRSLGVSRISRHKNELEIAADAGMLPLINNMAGVNRVRAPYIPQALTINGEEPALTKATSLHAIGTRGQNINVAVIDLDFYGLDDAIAAGELPADVNRIDFSGYGMSTSEAHGTAVAEVVHEMAPDAKLFLIKVGSGLDLANAKDYCITNNIHIINHSVGWFNTEWGDGKGAICDIANDAFSNGILWINAAGNSGEKHWQGMFTDANSDNLTEFSGSAGTNVFYASSGKKISVYLSWNDTWGGSTSDYDLYLIRSNSGAWSAVAQSVVRQSGTDDPVEVISVSAPVNDNYGIMIRKYSGTAKDLQLFTSHDLKYISARSIATPADAAGALAVGAIAAGSWPIGPVESYSSRGPSQDGRIKPDLCGVDDNLNYVFSTFYSTNYNGRFPGTSSAAPCVAGAAALIWSAYPYANNRYIWTQLTNTAIDAGTAGPDNDFGYGCINLTNIIDTTKATAKNIAVNNPYRGTGVVTFINTPKGTVISIRTITGKFVRQISCDDDSGRTIWDVRNAAFEAVAPGMYYCDIAKPGNSHASIRVMVTAVRP